jgi:hypothetical protein
VPRLNQPKPAVLTADSRFGEISVVLVDEALPDPVCGVALLSRSSLVCLEPNVDDGPIGRHSGRPLLPRSSWRRYRWSIAWRTVRRWTPKRRAISRIESCSRSWARRICSNSSTFDLTVMPQLGTDRHRAGGPGSAYWAGPESIIEDRPGGARSGDHTQRFEWVLASAWGRSLQHIGDAQISTLNGAGCPLMPEPHHVAVVARLRESR